MPISGVPLKYSYFSTAASSPPDCTPRPARTTVKRDDPALAARFVFFTGDTLSSVTSDFLERTGAPNLKKPFALRDIRVVLARVPPVPPAS
jgi:hypothetical protein